jgi:hypothetical protein
MDGESAITLARLGKARTILASTVAAETPNVIKQTKPHSERIGNPQLIIDDLAVL